MEQAVPPEVVPAEAKRQEGLSSFCFPPVKKEVFYTAIRFIFIFILLLQLAQLNNRHEQPFSFVCMFRSFPLLKPKKKNRNAAYLPSRRLLVLNSSHYFISTSNATFSELCPVVCWGFFLCSPKSHCTQLNVSRAKVSTYINPLYSLALSQNHTSFQYILSSYIL